MLGHRNTEENKQADKAQLSHPSNSSITFPAFSYQDVKWTIAKETHGLWENKRLKFTAKLHEIKITSYPWLFSENITRKQETVTVTRLRIWHTHITHQHLVMKREEPSPICISRGTLYQLVGFQSSILVVGCL